MEEKILRMLVEFVETASPIVWKMAKKQVEVCVVQLGFWMCFSIMGSIALIKLAQWCDKRAKFASYSDAHIGMALAIAGVIICAFTAIVIASNLIGLLLNPEYYAVRVLMRLVGAGP